MESFILKFLIGCVVGFILTALILEIKKKWEIIKKLELREGTLYMGSSQECCFCIY